MGYSDIKSNSYLFLKNVMEKAIDLGYAAAETYGITVERVGIMGFSEEGGAVWFVSLEDERVFAAAPGGFRYQDFAAAVTEQVNE